MESKIAILSVLLAAFLLLGCTGGQPPKSGSTSTVTIQNLQFNPSTVTIKAGDTVEWINNEAAPHSINSVVPFSFSSSVLNKGDSYQHTFTQAGNYDYTCGIHPFMIGKVVVQ